MRYRVSDEATVNLPKPRVTVSSESTSTQTDPIYDKGFGVRMKICVVYCRSYIFFLTGHFITVQFRWQYEQYNADNERLRKKVSEVGERMQF